MRRLDSLMCAAGAVLLALAISGCANQPIASAPKEPIALTTATVKIVGDNARVASTPREEYIGYWTNVNSHPEWPLKDLKPGSYKVALLYSLDPQFPGATVVVNAAGQNLLIKLESTQNWDDYQTLPMGVLKIDHPETAILAVKATNKPATYVMNLQKVLLTPVPQ